MILRPPQAKLQQLCLFILNGMPIRTIIADITPGGGKSKLPVILSSLLISEFAERLLWVVPRNSLKYQGEEEFFDMRFPTDKRLRATHGNDADPDRGTDGYITTYQAIGQSPESHADYVKKHRTILFLDEPHHIRDDSAWSEALRPLVESAALVIYASGTLSRGDGQRIAFLDYAGGFVDLTDTEHVRTITYMRQEAIRDGAILPVIGKTIDGAAEWISTEGLNRKIDSILKSGSDRSSALFTILRTEYANQLLNACLRDWQETRKEYQDAKMLVVATNIEVAKQYQAYIARFFLCDIATSEDTPGARKTIRDFKTGLFPILVTVAMAYEGLSVPSITHIACLTHIRSIEWLAQCFARANRIAPGKTKAVIWGPADRSFIQAIWKIEQDKKTALSDEEDSRPLESIELVEGVEAPGIIPLWSSAHGEQSELQSIVKISPSESERVLKQNIRSIRSDILSRCRPGNQRATENVFNLLIRSVVNKKLDDMTIKELLQVWMMLREEYRRAV